MSDSAIDVLVFGEEESILESLISPEPVELWMRSLVIVLLVGFSFFSRHLLKSEIASSNELKNYKDTLEHIVETRTEELQTINNELLAEIAIRKDTEASLERAATTDPLTSLYNRRKFNEILGYEIERDRRYKNGLSVILCDIDRFKLINDTYGHNTGDEVIKTLSNIVKNTVRKTDFVARWGGEEFILLIPDTDVNMATTIAEKVRKVIEETKFKEAGKVTASFGVAFFEGGDNEESLVARADKALYKAKGNGRNRVEASD